MNEHDEAANRERQGDRKVEVQSEFERGAEGEPEPEGSPSPAGGSDSSHSARSLMTRRRALLLAGVAVALVAGVGGTGAYLYRKRAGRSKAPPGTIRDYRVLVPDSTPRLVIARGPSAQNNVRAALAKLGGMGKFVESGDVVLIKPNIGWDRTPVQGANTDPELVAALVRACLEAGAADVIVTDHSVNQAARTFARSGIAAAAQQAGARVLWPEQADARSVKIPGKLGQWSVMQPFETATKVINVPVAKHHGLTVLTAGMKNWMGAIKSTRSRLHQGIDVSVAGLAALIRPTLTVVDATRVLMRNGPSGGNLDDVKRLDTVAVSLDPVAVDAWAATLLGVEPAKIGYLELAQNQGLGRIDYRSLGPVEITV